MDSDTRKYAATAFVIIQKTVNNLDENVESFFLLNWKLVG